MPARSTSATLSPRMARCSAIEVPTTPAPRTIASVRAMSPIRGAPTRAAALYMDRRARRRYQGSPPAGVFRNELVEAARGRARPGRPSWHVGSGSVDLHRPVGAAALEGLQTVSRRSDYRDADARIPAGESEGALGPLDPARAYC